MKPFQPSEAVAKAVETTLYSSAIHSGLKISMYDFKDFFVKYYYLP